MLFEFEDFVFEVFRGESGVGPGDTFYGAGEEDFRDVLYGVGEIVHVFIADGIFHDGGPEDFHELVGGAAVEDGAGVVEHVGVVVV